MRDRLDYVLYVSAVHESRKKRLMASGLSTITGMEAMDISLPMAALKWRLSLLMK